MARSCCWRHRWVSVSSRRWRAAASLAQNAVVLAAALAGFLPWNWPVVRYGDNAALRLAGGGVFVALFAHAWLFTGIAWWALAPLILCFFARFVARRIALPTGVLGQALRPLVLALVAALPAVIAAGGHYFISAGGDSAYR